MPFSLSKAETTRRDEIVAKLQEKWALVETAKDACVEKVAFAYGELNDTINVYQEAVTEAETFRDEVATRLRSEFDDKSEKWQEGEAGESAGQFCDAWEGNPLEDYEPLEVPELDLPDADHATDLEGLPTEKD